MRGKLSETNDVAERLARCESIDLEKQEKPEGGLWRNLTADLERLSDRKPSLLYGAFRYLSDAGFKAVALFRLATALAEIGQSRASRLVTARCVHLTGAEILPGAQVGPGLVIKHPVGIVVGHGAKIGRNCTILQGVTIGEKYSPDGKHEYPRLGDDVVICAGAVLIGAISIGNRSIVGANSVVVASVPPDTTVVGAPARALVAKRSEQPLARERKTLRR